MDENTTSIFSFVPADRYEKPAEPKTEAARSGLKALWKRFQRSRPQPETIDIHAELHSVSQQILDRVSPPPDWKEMQAALSAALQGWLASEHPEHAVQVIIGPPGSGVRQVLESLAEEFNWHVIDSPAPEEVLKDGRKWLEKLRGFHKNDCVMPVLEDFYLRHHNGLDLLRELLKYLKESPRKCLIGCNSWAWAYLSKTIRIDTFLPAPLALQALNAAALQQWFGSLASVPVNCCLVFRRSDNGAEILSLAEKMPDAKAETRTGQQGNDTKDEPEILKRIAARSRGIPLVAWAIWRNSLQIAGDETVDIDVQKAAAEDRGVTIWVKPWGSIELPDIPPGIARSETIILHTLLLHAGLPEESILRILTFPADEITRGLTHLAAHGLIKHEKGIWRVSLSGYPAVRQHLYNEGYLVDAF